MAVVLPAVVSSQNDQPVNPQLEHASDWRYVRLSRHLLPNGPFPAE